MNSKAHTFENGEGQRRHTVIVMQRVGRLGNQIALLANLIALSLATGVGVSHPTLAGYASYFTGTASNLLCRFPKGRLRNYPIRKAARTVIYYFCRFLLKFLVVILPFSPKVGFSATRMCTRSGFCAPYRSFLLWRNLTLRMSSVLSKKRALAAMF